MTFGDKLRAEAPRRIVELRSRMLQIGVSPLSWIIRVHRPLACMAFQYLWGVMVLI